MNVDFNWAEAEMEYERAIELNPNYATAHQWFGEFLAWMGRYDEGLAEVTRARELDPLSMIINTDVGKVYAIARRYDRAIALCICRGSDTSMDHREEEMRRTECSSASKSYRGNV